MPEVKNVRAYVDLLPYKTQLENGLPITLKLNPDFLEDIFPPDGYPMPEGYDFYITFEMLKPI